MARETLRSNWIEARRNIRSARALVSRYDAPSTTSSEPVKSDDLLDHAK